MNSSDTSNEIKNTDINSLVEILKSNDGIARQHARHDLVKIGEPALDALITSFEIKEEPLHWEVAKALSQIGTSKAAQTLIGGLEDKDFSIRWIAAEGLIHIGSEGLSPLLEVLIEKADSVWLREGSHHILHDLLHRNLIDDRTRECITPVLDALNHLEAATETTYAAAKAIKCLKQPDAESTT